MKKIFILLVAVSFFACQPATKPIFNLETAKSEIEAANKEITELLLKGDSVSLASAYGKDGAVMVSNSPSIIGKDNLTAFWGGFIRLGTGGITLTTKEVWGDNNYITEEGIFEIKSKDGTQLDKGKYLVLWKKEDGKWKLYRDMSSSDLPVVTK